MGSEAGYGAASYDYRQFLHKVRNSLALEGDKGLSSGINGGKGIPDATASSIVSGETVRVIGEAILELFDTTTGSSADSLVR